MLVVQRVPAAAGDVPRELVGAGEALGAAGEGAGVGLLARVGADVASLVLEAVESLIAERALVGAREVLARLFVLLRGVLQEGSHEAHGGGGHGGGRRGRGC